MEIVAMILDGVQHILNFIWFLLLLHFFLFGGKWQIGNFFEWTLPAVLRKSKRVYRRKDK